MVITVIGASGFVGQHLVRHILATTNHQLRIFCRSADRLDFGPQGSDRIIAVAGDITDHERLMQALEGSDVAVYLIHMMGHRTQDYAEAEAQAARTVTTAVKASGVGRIVYLGGLGDDREQLSKHLASRHRTGEILRHGSVPTCELRASMIIGRGSVAFDIITALATKLPLLAIPSWAVTETQPILLDDLLRYLMAAIELNNPVNEIIEIGGPRRYTYRDLVLLYGKHHSWHRHIITVPFVPVSLAAWWLSYFVPQKDGEIGRAMVESLNYPMIVTSTQAQKLFPTIVPRSIETAFRA